MGGGGADFGDYGGFGGFGDIGSIFDAFFGGGARGQARTGPERGDDLRYDLVVTLKDAFTGLTREIEVDRLESCPHCHGNGAEPGTPITTCAKCKGSGQVQQVSSTPFGRFMTVRPCDACGGDGRIAQKPCTECRGQGVVRKRPRIEVRVPPGIDSGHRLRLAGEGNAGLRGGPPGDVLVFVTVRPNDVFQRKGTELLCEVPVSFVQATLGDEVEVPTMDGAAKIRIPAGTQSGADLPPVKGKGTPHLRGYGRGDLHVKVRVVTPTRLTPKQKELLAAFAEAGDGKDDDRSGGLFARFKDAFSKKAEDGTR
jgi:molecular chaperone DnaJ